MSVNPWSWGLMELVWIRSLCVSFTKTLVSITKSLRVCFTAKLRLSKLSSSWVRVAITFQAGNSKPNRIDVAVEPSLDGHPTCSFIAKIHQHPRRHSMLCLAKSTKQMSEIEIQ